MSKTLKIRVESHDEFDERVLEKLIPLDEGGEIEESYGISLPSEEDLNRVLSDKNIELLRTIAREEPRSINEVSRLVDRDVHIVHDNLKELEAIGLIRFEDKGNRKKPVVWYDNIEIDIQITEKDSSETATA